MHLKKISVRIELYFIPYCLLAILSSTMWLKTTVSKDLVLIQYQSLHDPKRNRKDYQSGSR
jgi:hypothetical protein